VQLSNYSSNRLTITVSCLAGSGTAAMRAAAFSNTKVMKMTYKMSTINLYENKFSLYHRNSLYI